MEITPIKTQYGSLEGRDCIFLDDVNYKYNERKVELTGEISGSLASEGEEDTWISYTMVFSNIQYFKMVGLDLSYDHFDLDYSETTSFFEMTNSNLLEIVLKTMGVQSRHFIVETYDDVFEIVADQYEIKFGDITRD
ncbi:hypothetical protein MH117_03980 [Paenibacillus sp. ACRRX]|uniref:hypothetical protein n=1 Tax=Paenibacillus sp. ACRRX TaxID=2918206 RepID=UPI001EF459CE|nr:hypothetical protein [Paenibacillus sp. ACRRX]MCG7406565.1 hypothetical protein [Paenibacillus sp. ACRRX]